MLNFKPQKESWAAKSLAALIAFALFAFNHSTPMSGLREMPSAYYAESAYELYEKLSGSLLPSGLSVSAVSSNDETLGSCDLKVEYRLLGILPVKSANAHIGKRAYLTPCGQPVGISIYTEGVLVVGLGSFINDKGKQVSPAAEAGLRAGDVILSADEVPVASSSDLQRAIDAGAEGIVLSVVRDGSRTSMHVKPQAADGTGALRIGAWIRDSTVGIGTLSYYDAEAGIVAALGHAIIDSDTGTLLKVKDGKLVYAEILGVSKGVQGSPGELHGTFDSNSRVIGTVVLNEQLGVYGYAAADLEDYISASPIAVAFPNEVHTGKAVILASVEGGGPAEYSCRIIKTGVQNEPAQKGLVIEIDDPALIEKTGGIVQGMSGSPIVQDGMLVGVITHVFVNDPHKGYGAYAYWMYKEFGG